LKYKLSILFLFLFINLINSQQREALEKKKEKNLNDIKLTNELLDQTKNNKKITVNKLQILNKKIKLRTELIENINNEIDDLNTNINDLNENINKIEGEINSIKQEYAKLIYHLYIKQNFKKRLMFILASNNLSEVYERIKYFIEYFDYIKKQVTKLKNNKDELILKMNELSLKLEKRKELVYSKQSETIELENDNKNQKKIFNDLKNKENELFRKLKEKEKIKNEIEKEIKKIIEEEAKKILNKSNLYDKLTPDEKLLSNDFRKNKGKLPWPTTKGIITGYFGEQDHPVLKGIKIKNNGIDITTVKNEEIRCIFDGVVSKIIAIKGANYAVIIRHGNFITVYQNLIDINVKIGDYVKTKQKIGLVFSNDDNSVIHLEIWEELNKMDPLLWLSK